MQVSRSHLLQFFVELIYENLPTFAQAAEAAELWAELYSQQQEFKAARVKTNSDADFSEDESSSDNEITHRVPLSKNHEHANFGTSTSAAQPFDVELPSPPFFDPRVHVSVCAFFPQPPWSCLWLLTLDVHNENSQQCLKMSVDQIRELVDAFASAYIGLLTEHIEDLCEAVLIAIGLPDGTHVLINDDAGGNDGWAANTDVSQQSCAPLRKPFAGRETVSENLNCFAWSSVKTSTNASLQWLRRCSGRVKRTHRLDAGTGAVDSYDVLFLATDNVGVWSWQTASAGSSGRHSVDGLLSTFPKASVHMNVCVTFDNGGYFLRTGFRLDTPSQSPLALYRLSTLPIIAEVPGEGSVLETGARSNTPLDRSGTSPLPKAKRTPISNSGNVPSNTHGETHGSLRSRPHQRMTPMDLQKHSTFNIPQDLPAELRMRATSSAFEIRKMVRMSHGYMLVLADGSLVFGDGATCLPSSRKNDGTSIPRASASEKNTRTDNSSVHSTDIARSGSKLIPVRFPLGARGLSDGTNDPTLLEAATVQSFAASGSHGMAIVQPWRDRRSTMEPVRDADLGRVTPTAHVESYADSFDDDLNPTGHQQHRLPFLVCFGSNSHLQLGRQFSGNAEKLTPQMQVALGLRGSSSGLLSGDANFVVHRPGRAADQILGEIYAVQCGPRYSVCATALPADGTTCVYSFGRSSTATAHTTGQAVKLNPVLQIRRFGGMQFSQAASTRGPVSSGVATVGTGDSGVGGDGTGGSSALAGVPELSTAASDEWHAFQDARYELVRDILAATKEGESRVEVDLATMAFGADASARPAERGSNLGGGLIDAEDEQFKEMDAQIHAALCAALQNQTRTKLGVLSEMRGTIQHKKQRRHRSVSQMTERLRAGAGMARKDGGYGFSSEEHLLSAQRLGGSALALEFDEDDWIEEDDTIRLPDDEIQALKAELQLGLQSATRQAAKLAERQQRRKELLHAFKGAGGDCATAKAASGAANNDSSLRWWAQSELEKLVRSVWLDFYQSLTLQFLNSVA